MSAKPQFLLSLAAVLTFSLFSTQANLAVAEGMANLPASAEETTPLKTGDQAPSFTVHTVDSEAYDFDPDSLERPTVLISFRGGWCPYCNLHLSELRNVVPELREQGIDVLFLSGDAPDQLYSSLKQETQDDIAGLDYTILSDANIEAAQAFGTAFSTGSGIKDYLTENDVDITEGSIGQHEALSVPFVYVVNKSGEIVFDFVEADYKVRLPSDELLAAAESAM